MRVRALALVLMASACGKPNLGYPQQYELNFLRACEAQSPPDGVCRCTWDQIEAQIARADFDALERTPAAQRSSSPIQQQIQNFALDCAGRPAAP